MFLQLCFFQVHGVLVLHQSLKLVVLFPQIQTPTFGPDVDINFA